MVKKVIVSIVLVLSVVLFSNCSYAEEKGLVGYWKFDEGAKDFSGNGNDGTIYGALATAGKIGQALSFAGSGDYVDCGNDTSLDMGTGDFTITMWAKLIAEGAFTPYVLIGNRGGLWSSNSPGFEIKTLNNTDGRIQVIIADGSNHVSTGYTTTDLMDTVYHHIAIVFDRSGNCTIHVDGKLEVTRDISAVSGNINSGLHLRIGSRGSRGYYSCGSIDEVRIYNRALTETEVENHYKMGSPVI